MNDCSPGHALSSCGCAGGKISRMWLDCNEGLLKARAVSATRRAAGSNVLHVSSDVNLHLLGRRRDWVATVNSDRSTSALHRIPPRANAAHTLVIAVDHLQRCVVRLR